MPLPFRAFTRLLLCDPTLAQIRALNTFWPQHFSGSVMTRPFHTAVPRQPGSAEDPAQSSVGDGAADPHAEQPRERRLAPRHVVEDMTVWLRGEQFATIDLSRYAVRLAYPRTDLSDNETIPFFFVCHGILPEPEWANQHTVERGEIARYAASGRLVRRDRLSIVLSYDIQGIENADWEAVLQRHDTFRRAALPDADIGL